MLLSVNIEELLLNALNEMDPGSRVRDQITRSTDHFRIAGTDYKKDQFNALFALSTGKAALAMGRSMQTQLREDLSGSLSVTGERVTGQTESGDVIGASHPEPDITSVEAGRAVEDFIRTIPPGSLLIYAISGGTSAMLCLPAEEIEVGDLADSYRLMNSSGMTIYQMNTVRKHLSRIKGGQLLRYLDPSVTLVDLILSDVPDDDPAVIGSGPTTPDNTTFQDTYHLLLEYGLWEKLPVSVNQHIEKGIDGIVPETLKPGEDPLKRHEQHIIASPAMLADRVAHLAEQEGYHTWVSPGPYNRDVGSVADEIAQKAVSVRNGRGVVPSPAVLVWYGESTVQVTGEGKGGRNQELALRGALKIEGESGITWLSAGTDGIDGPTDAAGAIIDGKTIEKAREKGLNPEAYLERNDSYRFHEQLGTLLKTGPTGNNLMDIQIVVVESHEV